MVNMGSILVSYSFDSSGAILCHHLVPGRASLQLVENRRAAENNECMKISFMSLT